MRIIKARPVAGFPPRLVFIMAGQSNMSGRGLLSGVPSFPNAARIKLYANSGNWVGGYEPTDDPTGQIDAVSLDASPGCSPGMSFANSLATLRSGVEIGLVPCAKGGSSIAQWQRNLSRSTLYGSMLARAQEAAHQGTLSGLLFYQGENDADTIPHADGWPDSFNQMLSDLRSDLGLPNLPAIVTALGPDPGDPAFPYHVRLRNNQLAMTGANLAVVTAADLTGNVGDTIHLNTASQITLGQRYATAMNGLLP